VSDGGITPTGKGCGNSVVDENLGESCDDGNTLNGDGCNAICQIEANYICPTPGSLVRTLPYVETAI